MHCDGPVGGQEEEVKRMKEEGQHSVVLFPMNLLLQCSFISQSCDAVMVM